MKATILDTHSMCWTSTSSGATFIKDLQAAFVPVDLHSSYFRYLESRKEKSWVLLLVVCTCEVGCSFVSKTACAKLQTILCASA